MPITTTTKLQAVNTMLATIGSAPVNTLSGSNSADVTMAVQVLDEVSLNVQSKGWHFNTEYGVVLTADPITSEIVVASNVMLVDPEPEDSIGIDIVLRGTRLYDRKNRTYAFTKPVTAKVIWALEWEDLPQAAKNYLMIRASRIFQDRVVGSEKHHAFTERDELIALAGLRNYEGETADHSIFDNYSVYRVIDRPYPYRF
jgi:hypothetical protein